MSFPPEEETDAAVFGPPNQRGAGGRLPHGNLRTGRTCWFCLTVRVHDGGKTRRWPVAIDAQDGKRGCSRGGLPYSVMLLSCRMARPFEQ